MNKKDDSFDLFINLFNFQSKNGNSYFFNDFERKLHYLIIYSRRIGKRLIFVYDVKKSIPHVGVSITVDLIVRGPKEFLNRTKFTKSSQIQMLCRPLH